MGMRASPFPLRLSRIPGFEGRTNDVVYCGPLRKNSRTDLVVFFGGDIQDFTENMSSHRDNKNYVQWNLENTAQVLQSKFPESHITVVRPSRMEYKTFSCYENFVRCTKCGVPEHIPMHNGLMHLEKLLCNLSERLQTMSDADYQAAMEASKNALVVQEGENSARVNCTNDSPEQNICPQDIPNNTENCDVKLVGFSKGCVVLNQFLYEFHYFDTLRLADIDSLRIVSRIKDMYWLDGGHSGGKNTWITSSHILDSLTKLNIRIHIHVTPYQIEDDRRPWIKKEEKAFSNTLERLGVCINRIVHFENLPASLDRHFEVIRIF